MILFHQSVLLQWQIFDGLDHSSQTSHTSDNVGGEKESFIMKLSCCGGAHKRVAHFDLDLNGADEKVSFGISASNNSELQFTRVGLRGRRDNASNAVLADMPRPTDRPL